MDKFVSRIVDLFSFLADVLTVLFVIHSLSELTLQQMLSRLAVRENLGKVWTSFTEFLQTLDNPEVPEDAPLPPDPVPFQFQNDGYTALRHRQNVAVYYYSSQVANPNVTLSLNGQAVTSHAGRLLLSPPPLCINVCN